MILKVVPISAYSYNAELQKPTLSGSAMLKVYKAVEVIFFTPRR